MMIITPKYSGNINKISKEDHGILRLKVEATDQNGHTSYLFSNVRNQNTTVIDPLGATTVFHYDPVGQLLESIDPEGHSTYHAYDMLGRRTDRDHPSAGHTHWEYDPAGNMLRQTQNSGGYIQYDYDFSRPVHIAYSDRPWNNVWYEYGDGGSGNEAGRLVRQQDATGVQEFRYDFMGNAVYNRHTYVFPSSPQTVSLETRWQYDSWGRVQSITYPDRENVSYKYDFGGLLYSVGGYKNGTVGHTPYIHEILYDRFGQRTLVMDGDSVQTTYDYDPASRRLAHLKDSSASTGEVLQDNLYHYDAVGNLDGIVDNGRNHRVQTYKYDDADRLIGSDGDLTQDFSTGLSYGYTSGYEYSLAGRLLNKNVDSKRLSTATGPYQVLYDNNYSYDHPTNPYAVTHIQDGFGADYDFWWNSNGDLVEAYAAPSGTKRRLCWTEDNRLQAFMERSDEGGIAAWYNYSADGERNFKFTSPRLNIHQNATLFDNPPLACPTLYASPLLTLTRQGYTKHYFEEGRRICSKIGGGMLNNVALEEIAVRVPELAYNYDELFQNQHDGIKESFNGCIGADPQIVDGNDLFQMIAGKESQRDREEPAFFYHGDHLGSAAYLTCQGNIIQTLNYLPYGEDWVEYNFFHPADTTRLGIYRFNGKEKDYESGFHYYGARYHWSEVLTGWLSVDPMADKYPSLSPYNHCMWNPIKLVDLDGNDCTDFGDEWKYNTTTGMLSWVSDKGGEDNQTVDFVEGVGNQETLKKSVSFDGQIQDMFDFSVISEKADKITDGLIQMTGAAFTIGGGVLVGCGSGGLAAPAGAVMVGYGSYQFTDGLHNVLDGIINGGVNKYDVQNTVKDACKTFAIDGVMNGISSKKTPRSLTQNLSNTGKFITKNGGWCSMVLGLTWSALEVGNMLLPELKCENPRGATVTRPNSTNRPGRRVGLMPY